MPWPKGMPRKGHTNKDGTPHKQRTSYRKPVNEPTLKWRRVSASVFEKPSVKEPFKGKLSDDEAPLLHGDRAGRAVIEPCPMCGFAYADGGYCEECGWSAPVEPDPYETHHGPKYDKHGNVR